MRFAAYMATSVGFSGSGDREREESVAFEAFFRICLPMRYSVAARITVPYKMMWALFTCWVPIALTTLSVPIFLPKSSMESILQWRRIHVVVASIMINTDFERR